MMVKCPYMVREACHSRRVVASKPVVNGLLKFSGESQGCNGRDGVVVWLEEVFRCFCQRSPLSHTVFKFRNSH